METRRLAPLRVQAEAAVEAPQPASRGWFWLATSLVLAGLGLGVLTGVVRISGLRSSHSTLSLRASDSGGTVRIEWDRSAQPILEAQTASVLIVEGDHRREITIDPELLRRGSVVYRRLSTEVEIRLRVQDTDGKPIQELTRLSGLAPVQYASSATPSPAPRPKAARTKKRAAVRSSRALPARQARSVQDRKRSWLQRARVWPPPNPVRLFRKRSEPAADR